MTLIQKFEAIKCLDSEASIRLTCVADNKWYVDCRLEQARNNVLEGLVVFEDTPEQAIHSMWMNIESMIIIKINDKYYQWIGYMWLEVDRLGDRIKMNHKHEDKNVNTVHVIAEPVKDYIPPQVVSIPSSKVDLTIKRFQRLNANRCYSEEAKSKWGNTSTRSLKDWALCIGGETGELLNEVKKYSLYTNPSDTLWPKIADETADVITYCILLLDFMGLDAETVLMNKFEEVSERIGWEEDYL